MLTGRSYWHVPQGLGCAFEPDKINGYFNDMTAKTTWTGLMNDTGIPVNVLSNGETVEIPTVIVQKALGHWDRWLIENDELHKSEFLKLCQWLLDNQDKQGGWDIWGIFGLKCSSKYSAMTQGEAISALLRAYLLTNNENYLEVGEKAVLIFRVPVSRGGVTYFEGEDIFLEEVPMLSRETILNGWIFAIFGLYDYCLIRPESWTSEMLSQTLQTLDKTLEKYDAGYWSYYDSKLHLASPFYHALHIAQLTALYSVTQSNAIKNTINRFQYYENSRRHMYRAVAVKAYQKLKEPAEGLMIIK